MDSEKHDSSSTFISPSYQGRTSSENTLEPDEQAGLPPVQEYDTNKSPMQQPVLEQQPSVQTSVNENHTEASQPRRSTRSNLGQIFPTNEQNMLLLVPFQEI